MALLSLIIMVLPFGKNVNKSEQKQKRISEKAVF